MERETLSLFQNGQCTLFALCRVNLYLPVNKHKLRLEELVI